MNRVYIIAGYVRGHHTTYGYFMSLEGAIDALKKQAESFASRGFLVEAIDPIPAFNEHAEIRIWDDANYYGDIRITSNILNA